MRLGRFHLLVALWVANLDDTRALRQKGIQSRSHACLEKHSAPHFPCEKKAKRPLIGSRWKASKISEPCSKY